MLTSGEFPGEILGKTPGEFSKKTSEGFLWENSGGFWRIPGEILCEIAEENPSSTRNIFQIDALQNWFQSRINKNICNLPRSSSVAYQY